MNISSITTAVGLVLLASGAWLFDPSHAAAFGVSERAWLLDAGTGLILLAIGLAARPGQPNP